MFQDIVILFLTEPNCQTNSFLCRYFPSCVPWPPLTAVLLQNSQAWNLRGVQMVMAAMVVLLSEDHPLDLLPLLVMAQPQPPPAQLSMRISAQQWMRSSVARCRSTSVSGRRVNLLRILMEFLRFVGLLCITTIYISTCGFKLHLVHIIRLSGTDYLVLYILGSHTESEQPLDTVCYKVVWSCKV